LGSGPAVKPVVAEKIGPGANVRPVHPGDVGRLYERPTVIGKFHPAASLGQKIGIVREGFIFLSGEAGQVGGIVVDVTLEREEESFVVRRVAFEVLQKPIGKGAEDGDSSFRGETPAG